MRHRNCLNPLAFGLAAGILLGVSFFLLAFLGNFEFWRGAIEVTSEVYPNYGTGLTGGLYGLLWGFLDGFLGGLLFGLLYNWFSRFCLCCKMKKCTEKLCKCGENCPCGCNCCA